MATAILHIKRPKETFTFADIKERPIPSLLRDFSAPVRLDHHYSVNDLLFLMRRDRDPFNRYEAAYRLALICLHEFIADFQKGHNLRPPQKILDAFGTLLEDTSLDQAFIAEVLTLPAESVLIDEMVVCDFDAAHFAREELTRSLAHRFEKKFLDLYETLNTKREYALDPGSMGKRALKNTCLAYLSFLDKQEILSLIYGQYKSAGNMTDRLIAFKLLCDADSKETELAVKSFYDKYNRDSAVINKWFAAQAASKMEEVLERVKYLEKDPVFDQKNPNRQRSLYGVFAGNLVQFHDKSGKGYTFLADKILEIDRFNPSMAGRFAVVFKKYSKLDAVRKILMKRELERILKTPGISSAVYEIISKTLESGK